MRIGQAAALLGISTRTIRHYHHIGVLPEPERDSNGYRRYETRELVTLARARRLAELGLSLEEVADVIADDAGVDLVEILMDLDTSLADQERQLKKSRAAIAELLTRAGTAKAPPTDTNETDFFDKLAGTESPSANLDRELMSLLPKEALARLPEVFVDDNGEPVSTDSLADLYHRMDELAEANADDRRVEELAARIVELVPDALRGELRSQAASAGAVPLEALAETMSPAQAAVMRHVLRRMGQS